jgi:exosortase/archaeosortase family protein
VRSPCAPSPDAVRTRLAAQISTGLVWRFALAFFTLVFLFSALVRVDIDLADGMVTSWVTHGATTVVATLMTVLGMHVAKSGNVIHYAGSSFEVVANCTGIEIIGLFGAAVLAFPSPWLGRLKVMAIGVPVLVVLNLLRMISLIYVGARSSVALDYGHLYVWPVLLLAVALAMWLYWAGSASRDPRLVV